ncbi:MAG: selenide, water dikinase SelD [Albidovulum sp.]|nr:selenide, water dikinase SelD [Albidovulum sp.]
MKSEFPKIRDLVFVGGGHTHALVLLFWSRRPVEGVRLTLINPDPVAYYSGMLPGFIAGHYAMEDLEIDLVRLAKRAGARLVIDAAAGIDRKAKLVRFSERADIAYDILSLDTGVTSSLPGLPGYGDCAQPAKPLGKLALSWDAFVSDAAEGRKDARAVVIGGGVAGMEIALAAAWRLKSEGAKSPEMTLIESRRAVLRDSTRRTRTALLERAGELGVDVRTGVRPAGVRNDGVLLEGGEFVRSSFTIGAAGGRPAPWLEDIGLETTDGFLNVDRHLRCPRDTSIFAAGDCCHMLQSPRPKAGVFAVRQAPVLWNNIRSAVAGGRLKAFLPQRDYLKLVSAGSKFAVAEKFGLSVSGRRVWALKDRIDRRFMNKFAVRRAPEAKRRPPPSSALGLAEYVEGELALCGGCGAKLGQSALRRALANLPPPLRSDVLSAVGDDAAVLRLNDGVQALSIDHLRAFVDDPWLHSRIAAVHALGDIWAMGAHPQSALASIILPRMPEGMQAHLLREILHAASGVFAAEGADLVGGHTSQGPELSIGFSVTGLSRSGFVGKSGAGAGDRLMLTKPIGSGTILAAAMSGSASAREFASALATMQKPSGRASRILSQFATAMTDTTGFGLAGHLMEVLDASAVAARVDLDSVPTCEGAMSLSDSGIRSSLWESNFAISARMKLSGRKKESLLFDPQTAGGLLAAVPAEKSETVLNRLLEIGEDVAVIGEIVAGPPRIFVD